MEVDKDYRRLEEEIRQLAHKTKGQDSHVVMAQSYQVKAIGDLDNQLEELNHSIKHLNKTTSKLMTRQIWLILIQTVIAVIIGYAAIKIT